MASQQLQKQVDSAATVRAVGCLHTVKDLEFPNINLNWTTGVLCTQQ